MRIDAVVINASLLIGRSLNVPVSTDYSITRSACIKNDGEILSPNVLAVFMLINNSYLLGSCTGRSPVRAPR